MIDLREHPAQMLSMRQRRRLAAGVRIVATLCITLLFVSPLYISFVYALKTPAEMGASNPLALPATFYLGNFRDVITKNSDFQTGFMNSLITTVFIVGALTVITPMAAYVLARSRKKIYNLIYYIFLMGILIPFQCIMFPTYVNLKAVGLMNSLAGFIIVRTGFQIGMCILIITDFVSTVPMELEEAANIDGASIFSTFWKIVYPLMKPINVTMLVLNTLFSWNDFYVSVTILQSAQNRTLPLAQFVYRSESGVDVNLAFAFFTLCMLPVLVLYLFAQRYIVSGIMSGAVKG
ncbi:MAG: carbohydrate ABC transporter permease [Candidatus Limiplasma sp.]|nr:carbohydrate ABC transporter permease [Candidatus Limiplasma sp.]